jgi:glycosyltransferase involved in cell wall biosynthesis
MNIIALIPIRNEAWVLETSLSNISEWADYIIVADQMSTDRSREICSKFPKVRLIDNTNLGHSNKVRWQLLDEARKIEGRNLIVCIDADEIVAPETFKDKEFFNKYSPGQCFELPWIQLWKSNAEYRTDSGWDELTKQCVFIDDRIMDYHREAVINDHTARIPLSSLSIIKLDSALLHLEYVPFAKSQVKQAWYRCSELIAGKRSARRINATYMVTKDSPQVTTEKVTSSWIDGVKFPENIESLTATWHTDCIMDWFKTYGIVTFELLDIWHIHKLKDEFVRQTGREPKPVTFPAWLLFLNKIKNKLRINFIFN